MKTYLSIILLLIFFSCNRLADKTKEGINRGGEVVGETATEFFDGISKGVDNTLDCKIELSESLKNKGLKTGTYSIDSQSNNKKNKLTLYLIFQENFKDNVTAKVYNKSGFEIGRATTVIIGAQRSASYFDFIFDERTDIGFRNKIIIE
ncbi:MULTISPECIES: hypothetical protein [Winogradskyella]|uniref:hypothetical protein n=1 Tax=Winogradskyella TaxID=286104 RepID=UPI0015C84B0B|nr:MULTISPECIES: hypothetical protein [Winogradskyella]QXP79435.1 hypothetical protein H0I32_01995 [Winogradskyella sp. HaHa_3_26]